MASTISIYAPLSAGLSGQVLYSNGNGKAPTWGDLNDEVGTDVYLNGSTSAAVSATIYAPLSSGTDGKILVSGGPNVAPSWKGSSVTSLATTAIVTSGSLTFYNIGKICVLTVHCLFVNTATSGATIGNVPSGYYPKYQVTSVGANGNAAKYTDIAVMPDGRVMLYGQNTTDNVYGEVVWIC